MKNLYTTVFVKFLLPLLILLPAFTFAQAFYSVFPDDEAEFHVTYNNPAGSNCTAPVLHDQLNVANQSMTDFAKVNANLTQALTCKPTEYKIKTDLNLDGAEYLPAGYNAGFLIKTSSLIDLAALKNNIIINTYFDGEFQEASTPAKLLGVDVLAIDGKAVVYFKTARNFSMVELVVKSSIIPLNIAFEADFFYGTGFSNEVLPVSMSNFKATLNGNAAALSWTATNEVNIKNYEVERSANGVSFTTIGSINVVKGAETKLYHYTDANLLNGSYYYRIKSVGTDGALSRTNIASVSPTGTAKAAVYPTILKAGKMLWLKTSETGKLNINVYDLQGKLVMQLSKTTNGLTSIATTALSHGMYIVKAAFANSAAIAVQAKVIVE